MQLILSSSSTRPMPMLVSVMSTLVTIQTMQWRITMLIMSMDECGCMKLAIFWDASMTVSLRLCILIRLTSLTGIVGRTPLRMIVLAIPLSWSMTAIQSLTVAHLALVEISSRTRISTMPAAQLVKSLRVVVSTFTTRECWGSLIVTVSSLAES
jgi:hypothetical protein